MFRLIYYQNINNLLCLTKCVSSRVNCYLVDHNQNKSCCHQNDFVINPVLNFTFFKDQPFRAKDTVEFLFYKTVQYIIIRGTMFFFLSCTLWILILGQLLLVFFTGNLISFYGLWVQVFFVLDTSRYQEIWQLRINTSYKDLCQNDSHEEMVRRALNLSILINVSLLSTGFLFSPTEKIL